MANRVLPANVTMSVWFRTDAGSIVTDNIENGSGTYTVYPDGVVYDTVNNKVIRPEHTTLAVHFETPRK